MDASGVRFLFFCCLWAWVTSSSEGKLLLSEWGKLTVTDDYDTQSFSKAVPGEFHWAEVNGTVQSTGTNYTAYAAKLSRDLPHTFGFRLPPGGCGTLEKTSVTAQKHNCTYATNAGYFNTHNGNCIGNLIIDGDKIQLPATNRVNFGLTNSSFIVGYLTNATLSGKELDFLQLIQVAGWLVRKGVDYINTSKVEENLSDYFVTEKAPRSAIGATKDGDLMLVQVDGVEDEKIGLDLYEFTEVLLKEFGLWQAANMDGGGSSVSVYKGKVVSKPTCIDISLICERTVTSITCMHDVDVS